MNLKRMLKKLLRTLVNYPPYQLRNHTTTLDCIIGGKQENVYHIDIQRDGIKSCFGIIAIGSTH